MNSEKFQGLHTVIGQVPSVIEYLHWATVCVIPIRNSTGTKIRSIQTLGTRQVLL